MHHSPDRPSRIVKLRLPSLVVKLRLNGRAATASHAVRSKRRCTSASAPSHSAYSITAPDAEAASDISLDRGLQHPSIPTVHVHQTSTSNMAPHVLDPKLFGRERSTRKRTSTPSDPLSTAHGTTHRDPQAPAKKRKLNRAVNTPQSMIATGPDLTPGGTAGMHPDGLITFGGTLAPLTPPSEGSQPSQKPVFLPPAGSYVDLHGHSRPLQDASWDQRYASAMLQELEGVLGQKRTSVHKRSAGRIRDLLSLATYPSADEAKFLSQHEALAELAPDRFFNGPIFAAAQQPLALSTVSDFLGEYYDDSATVHIQDSSASTGKTATWARSVTMKQVKERFQEENTPEHCPWNMLELATHHDDGLRPAFLNNEDCRLITKLKIPNLADETRRRKYEPGFKEVEKWALLAEAGALTEPHQDSHGYSTFITINQGCVGFGWLSHPTPAERAAWKRDPQHFRGGQWRYVILKPGQTVYFPAGTVHMVFRLKAAGNSLAFGGHILRCSNIVHWVTTLLEEHANQNIVNEDLGDAAVGYLERVEKFVDQARKQGAERKWGGEESVREFKRLKRQFVSLPKPKVSPASKKMSKAAAMAMKR